MAEIPPAEAETRAKSLSLWEVSPRDSGKPSEAIVTGRHLVPAATGFEVVAYALQVREIRRVVGFSVRVSEDRRFLAVYFGLWNGALEERPPSRLDLTVRWIEGRAGTRRRMALTEGLILERAGTYPLWRGRGVEGLRRARLLVRDGGGETMASGQCGEAIALPNSPALITVDCGDRTPLLTLRIEDPVGDSDPVTVQ